MVDVGRDPATGRRRQRTKGGFRTKREAEQALAEVIRSLGEGSYVARDPQTLEEWINRWLVTMEPKVRSSTLRDYANGLGRVSARLGQMPLQALRPLDIEEMYAALLKEGHRYGGGLAPKTVRNLHIALRRSLADAHRLGLVPRNVAALVKPPAPVRHEITTWTADEVRRFLARSRGRSARAGVSVAGGDGDAPRRSARTPLGQRRSRRGADRRESFADGRERPDGLGGPEDIAVASVALVGCRDGRGAASASAPAARGEADRGRALARRRPRVLQRDRQGAASGPLHAGVHIGRTSRRVRPIRLHDLRHTWATLALQAGIHPKVVSERLGHATTGITLDIYSHVQPELDAHAATAVAELFGEKAQTAQ